MRVIDDQFTEALSPTAERAVKAMIEAITRQPYWWRKLSAPDCDCYACRPPLAFPGAPRTIQQAAAQEAAKPKEQRKPAKPKPRSIADEWLDRR